MQDMVKPNLNDIKTLIEQAEKLKQEVKQLKKKSFLTPLQSEAIKAGTDTALYILWLSYTNKEECWSNFGTVDSYFTPTGSVNRGRFAQNLKLPSAVDYGPEEPERIEWYNPNKHAGLFVRYDFDEKEFRNFLNQYTAKQRQLYWKNHIQPLIIQLDTDLTPWLPFMKPYIDTEGIQKAIKTAEPVKLSDAIYELKKIQKVIETESKQAPVETEQAEAPSEDKSIEQIAKKAAQVAQKLEKCITTDPVTDRVPPRLGYYQRAIKSVEWFFSTDLVVLRWHKPDVAKWVQEKYDKLLTDIKAVDQAIANSRTELRPSIALENLRQDMAKLTVGLRDIAKMAKEESAAEKSIETRQKAQPVKETPKEAENIFRKDGDYWQVAYQGSATTTIKNSKGMSYIHRLLEKPDESIAAMQFYVKGEIIYMDSANQQDVADSKTIADCQKRLIEIDRELDEAKKNNDFATQDRLNKEQEEILTLLKTDTFGGKSAKFSDNKEKARIAVTNAINRALDNIKEHNQSLYQHLNNSILRGSDFTYTLDKKINWEL